MTNEIVTEGLTLTLVGFSTVIGILVLLISVTFSIGKFANRKTQNKTASNTLQESSTNSPRGTELAAIMGVSILLAQNSSIDANKAATHEDLDE